MKRTSITKDEYNKILQTEADYIFWINGPLVSTQVCKKGNKRIAELVTSGTAYPRDYYKIEED